MDISALTGAQLLERAAILASVERAATAAFVETLSLIDEGKSWEPLGFLSTFEYCVLRLRLSESAAYKRIRAARAIRLFPPIFTLLRDGRLCLEAVAMIHPHLKDPDAAELVHRAAGMRIKKLEALLAERRPPGPQRDLIRYVGAAAIEPPAVKIEALPLLPRQESIAPETFRLAPAVNPTGTAQEAALRESIDVAGPSRAIRFSFTADEEFRRTLERARQMMRHKYPDGRLEGVLHDALKALLERRDPVIRWKLSRAGRRKKA